MFDLRRFFTMETFQNFPFNFLETPVSVVIQKYYAECHFYQTEHHSHHRVDPHFVLVIYSYPEENSFHMHIKIQGIGRTDQKAVNEAMLYADYLKRMMFEESIGRTRFLLRKTRFYLFNEMEFEKNKKNCSE